jgi:hypothetical protein
MSKKITRRVGMGIHITVPWSFRLRSGKASGKWWSRKTNQEDKASVIRVGHAVVEEEDLDHLGVLHRTDGVHKR